MSADLQYTLGLDGSDFNATAKAAEKTSLRLGSVLAGLGVTAFAGGVLKRGFEFNQSMRDSEAAVAKVIAQFQHLDDVAAKESAAAAMRQIVELEPKAAGSLADLTNGFLSTLAASQAAGLSVSQNIDLVGRFANAMANANIPTEQLGQEMRSIVTANIGADSSLAKVLGITNEMVKQAAEAGNLYGFLTERIGKLGLAGDTAAVAFSSLQSAVDKAAGALAAGLFDAALEGSKGLTAQIDANRETFKNFGAAIGVVAQEVIKFASFANEAVKQTAFWAAVAHDMLTTGRSFSEITAEIEAIENAHEHAAQAAEHESAKTKAVLDAVNKEANAKRRAAAEAAEATKTAGLSGPGAAPDAGSKSKKGDTGQGAARAFDEILDKQARLDALKRDAALDELDAAGKAAAIRQEILRAEQEIAALKADPFAQNQGKILDAAARKVELERAHMSLQKAAAADAERAAQKAAGQAKEQKERAQEMSGNRNGLLGELAILEALSRGQNRKADAIKRQLQIERDKRDIMRQTGASEEDAMRLATRKADLEAKKAKREGKAGRSHIGGVTRRRLLGSPGGGGLDKFKREQAEDSDFDRLQKGAFGKNNLAGRAARSVGGAAATTARAARLMGQTDTMALSDRARATLAPPGKGDNKSKTTQQDPTTAKLDAILSELTRIRTA